ncbi:hypothetical protein E8E12_010195 [Didymella heteroderae]|uniref:Uncharacterized protein n=1 Tax=Didymella heteroderae TaxID=1769908 RepID=A0A9P5C2Y1_9PLEO|nr:hypothetical protein E8E12_010195 [Didymella heteroderae]
MINMTLRTKPEEDDWQYIKDAKKRKQVQDRLAQRARRKRLREARVQEHDSEPLAARSNRTLGSDSSPASNGLEESHLALEDLQSNNETAALFINTPFRSQIVDMNELNLTILGTSSINVFDPDLELLPANLHSPLPSPTRTQLTMPLNVFTALFLNGEILGLTCGTEIAAKSLPPRPSTPIPLRPTSSQLTTVHYQWIDRFPFPKLRDSLIRLQAVIDLQDFLNDIFVMPSFQIKTGAESWDARAWKMEGAWARKWAWLFF